MDNEVAVMLSCCRKAVRPRGEGGGRGSQEARRGEGKEGIK